MRKLHVFFILLIFIACGNQLFSQCSVTLGPNQSICTGQSTTLTSTVTGGPPTTYAWSSIPAGASGTSSTLTVSPTVTTKYIVHITGNGCNSSDTIKITVNPLPTAPVITVNPTTACSGSTFSFSTTTQAGDTYTWNYGDGTTGTGTPSSHIFTSFGTGTTTYTVTATATTAAGCTATASQTVTVTQQPPAALAQGSGVDTVTLNGVLNFYKCVNTAIQSTNFNFVNPDPGAGNTTTIIWGDTGATVTINGSWTNISHIYGRGPFNLTYIVSNGTGCPDTLHYIVFFGNNPAGGIASLGSTSICGPDSLLFAINNWQSNAPGTIYTVTFNDGTPPLTFGQPPPDTIAHWFGTTSCGTSSSNGSITFNNAFKATLTVENPCGITAGAVVPIYVSFAPKASYAVTGGDTTCLNSGTTFTNTTLDGQSASNTGCDVTSPIIWNVLPATGWNIAAGSLGSDNGFMGVNYDPTSWTPGSNTLSLNFTTAGTYQVQIVSGNSCGIDTFIQTICVTPPPVPSFTLAPAAGCAPLTVNTTNTTPPVNTCGAITYVWTVVQDSFECNPVSGTQYTYTGGTGPTSTSPSLIFADQGTYAITLVASNACGAVTTAPKNVTVKTVPQVTITAPALVCAEVNISPVATILPCSGTVSAYNWSFPGGTPSSSTSQVPGTIDYTGSGSHTITLDVTNECGTTIATAVVVVDTIPVAIVGAPQSVCSGSTVQIGGPNVPGLTYVWTPATGLSSTTVSDPIVTLTNNGTTPVTYTYYLTVTNTLGCSNNDSVKVTVYPPATVSAGPPVSVCGDGASINLNGTFGGAATSVTWTSNNGGTFANPNSAVTTYTPSITSGTIILTLTTNDPAGPCPAATSSLTVTVIAPPVAVAGNNDSICSGGSAQLGAASQAGYTYLWSPATGLSATNVSNPTATLTNNGTTVISQTYTLIVTANGCKDTASVTVYVFPPATVSITPPASVCAGATITLTGTIGGSATSATWSSPSGTFNPTNALTTIFTPTIASGFAVVTLTTNVPSTVCPAAAASVNVTVKPIPTVTTNPLHQTICSGSSTPGIVLISGVAGTTYTWTGSSPDGITGFIASGTTNVIPSQTLTDPNTTPGIVVYVITPTAAGCPGPPVNDTIYVNPLPNVNPIPGQTICSAGTSTAVTPTSTTAGTTFSWVAASSGNLTGYTTSGTGTIPAQTITNTGSVIDSVVFSITPTAYGCPGTAVNFTIVVDPTPHVTLPAAQSICSGTTSAVAVITSTVAGATFTWTAAATAGITGFTASGTGNIPAQTLNNSTLTAGTVTYTITATANGCPGPPANYIITVKPIPTVTATPSPDTICNNVQTNIALTSNVAGTTFAWTVNEPGTVTGASAGSGTSIQQTLDNTSSSPQTVSYYITPTANGCSGKTDTVNIVVNPTVVIAFSALNQTICSGQTSALVNITSTTAGAVFSWTSAANGITGVTPSGTNTIPAQTLTNSTNASLTAVYTVSASYDGCPGPTAPFDITVNPIPHVILPAFQTICSGTATTAIGLTSNVAGATYTWTGSSPDGITGFIASGNTATIPSQTLTDPNTTAGIVVYVITPTAAGCTGPADNDTITVNPLPNVNAVSPQTICSGATSTAVTLSSTTAGTTFSWTASNGGSLSGYTASGTGNIPVQTITNSGTTIDSVVYVITPKANGCNGPAVHFDIIVNPVPDVVVPVNQTICSGATSTVVSITSAVAGTTFNWAAAASAGITGFTASGTGNIPAQTLSNSTNAQGTVTYTISPTANGCPGTPATYIITVNPVAIVNASPDTICTGTQTNISLTSNVAGATFSWTFSAPGSVIGAGNGTGSAIQQVLTNSSNTSQTVTYIITPKAHGCNGTPDTVTAVVGPAVTIVLPANQTICSGQSTQAVAITSPAGGTVFSWTSQANGVTGVTASGTDSIPVQTLVNTANSAIIVVYNINATYANCPAQTASYDITVDPTPHVILPAFQTICSGSSTNNINLSSNVAGTTYSWTGSSPNGITGFTASGTASTIPAQILTDPNTTPGIVVYVITPTASGCPGPAISDTISVNPLPNVNALTPQAMCSGSTSTAVTLSSTTAGTTFSWTASNGGSLSGYTGSGTGNIPTQTITNSGTTIDSVVYLITPKANGCNGPVVHYDITVYPVPNVNLPLNQTICSGVTSTIATITSNVAGTTFSWTAAATANIAGFTASGTGNISAQTLVNTGTTQGTVTFTVTPSANGCPGPPANYTITVNPVAIVTATPSPDTICTATQTSIALSSNVAGTTFSWTVTAPGSITGAANGSGNNIQQVLTNSSASSQTVAYIVTPRANGCNGLPDTVDVVVGPAVTIQLPANQTICSGQSTQAVAITSPAGGVAFSWTSQANGIAGVAPSGTDSIPVQTLVNSGSSVITVVYNITAAYANCASQSASYDIVVHPTPHVILPAFQTICSGTSTTNINLSSAVAGTTYTWSSSSPDGVTGFIASGTTATIPAQTLTNAAVTPGIVVYVVTPTASGCPGPAVSDTITVNPLPNVNPLTPQTVCSGTSTVAVSLSSTTAGTTFSWTGNNGGNLSGYSTSGIGDIPIQTITNSGTTIDSVVYIITPNASGCNGPAVHYDITVDPVPHVILPVAQSICSGTSTAVATLTSAVAGTTFSWTATATGGITGFTASGSGNIPVQALTNPGNTAGTVTYTITPTANGCPGPNASYVVTVKPIPVVTATPVIDTICPSAQTNISLASNVAGTTFAWTASAPASITGEANGTGSTIQQVLANSSVNPQSVTYTITPTATGCPGSPETVTVVVLPGVNIQFSTTNQTICTGQSTVAVAITSPSPNVIFSWTSVANGISGVIASGTDSIPVQVLLNNGNASLTANYNVVAGYTGCPSQTATYDITVNPAPHVILPPAQTICSGTSTTAIAIGSNVAGTNFTWTGSSPDGVTGFIASGNTTTIPAQVLTNAATTVGIVIYSITPNAAGCPGLFVFDTITVNPLPNVNPLTPQTICSGGTSIPVNLSSTTAGTTFAWTGNSATLSGYNTSGVGNIPAQTITNSGTIIDSVVFIITPTANGCNGPNVNYDITVDPTPHVILPAAQSICSNTSTVVAALTSGVAGTTYSWSATATPGITGFTNSGTGNIPVQTLVNPGNVSGGVTYAITPTANGCPGPPSNYVVTVKPLPVITATPSVDTICPSTATNISLSSSVAATTFNWIFNEPASVTGAASGTGNSIQQTLNNTSQNPQTVLYIITPTAAGCNGPLDTVDIVVHPGVAINFSLANQTICSAQTMQAVVITSPSPGVTFAWTSQANGVVGVTASGTDSIPAQTLFNNGNTPLTVNYNATAGYPGCPLQVGTYSVLVNPIPAVILPAAQTICSGTSTQSIAIASNVAGTTFTWTGSSPDGVTGFTASGNTAIIPAQTLTNASAAPAYVIFAITPLAAGCPGIVVYDTVTVNPLPVINPVPEQTICSENSSTQVILGSATVGTTFAWTASGAGLSGFISSGNGNIPAQTITNAGTTIDSVVFTITPTASGCNGPASTFTLVVDPLPNVNLPAGQIICSNETDTAVVLISNVAGTTFAWTASGGPDVSGFTASGTGNIPAQVISNSGNVSEILTYTITPTANGCPGPNATYNITIKPLPVISATPAPDTICPSTQTNITLSSTIPGTAITWIVNEPAAITGATAGSGDIIQQVLSNSSSNPQTVLYIISSAVNGCSGLPDTVDVLVHPGVALQLSSGPQTICSGQNTLPVAISSLSPGVTFSWTSQANGVGGVAASGTDTIPVQTLTNTGNFGLTVDYYISAGYPGCPITTTTYGIAVNPAPSAILPPFQSICSGTPSQVIPITSNVPGTTFTWTGVSPDGVTGYPVSGTTSDIPSQVLTNASTGNEIVVYTITPSSSGCPGVTVNDTTTVKPLPVINPLVEQTLCTGGTSTGVYPSSSTAGTTFTWSVIYNGNISGFTTSGSDSIPAQTLSNNGTAIDSVVYAITPMVNGCNGTTLNYAIIVNPVPDVILPASQDICSGTVTNVATLTSYVAGSTYSWSATGTAGVSGFTPSGTGNIPNQTLVYTGVTSGSVTYIITPSANSCVGPPSNYVVVVKPVPVVTATPAFDTICPSTQTNIAISSNVAGTTFTWTVNQPASVTGASAGAGNSILQILSNGSQTMQTVLYIITPDASGCVGLPDTVTLVVRPEVAVNFSLANQTICSGQNTLPVAVTSTSPGVSFTWTSQANGITGVASSGTDSIPVQTLVNPTTGVLAVTYNVTAGYGGCPPVPASYDIVVNPNPAVILPPAQTICSGTASQTISISSTVSGTAFTWTGTSPDGITGFSAGGNSAIIPSDVLTNPASTQGIVVYSVTPSSTGCPGVAVNDTIYVNPSPVIDPLTAQTICSGGTSTIVNITSATAGTTFNWNVTHSGDLTGYTGNGNGNIPAQTITNNGFTIDSVVYTITPTASTCNGPAVNYDIIVNPLPNVILPTSQTICSNATTATAVLTSDVTGTTFTWTATGTAGLTGFTANGTGNIPPQTIINPNNVAGTVTYTITPTANNCPGPVANYVVTINPTPIASATPSPDTICPSAQTSITITSTVANTSFSWTATAPASVTGESNGTGSFIQQVLSNNSVNPQTVTYVITPEANGCPGPTDTALAVVNPGISVQFTPAPQTICSGQSTQPVQITSTSPNVSFAWTSQANGVTGVTPSGTDSITVQTLTNNSVFAATVDYTVTASYANCPGYTATYSIVVNPTPAVILPPLQTVCSGAASQPISISSNVTGTTFTWTGSSPDGVTGFTAGGNGSVIPSQILTNSSAQPGFVVFIITPSSTGCPGVVSNDTITVNPLPVIDPLVAQTICSGNSSALVNITSATAGATFSWNVFYSGNLSGFTGNGAGNIPAQTITNNGATIDSVVYTITPSASGCNGPSVNYDIVVDPSPNVIAPAPQTICSGGTTAAVVLSSDVTGATFSWSATGGAGITGFNISGTGNIPAQIITNSGNTSVTVTYVITATANGCTGPPTNFVVTIKPLPVATALPSPDTICNGTQTNIAITSTVAGTTFSWTVNAAASITGAANGTGNNIQQTLTDTSSSAQTATYVITPVAGGCVGPNDTMNVVVNPVAGIQFTPAPQVICSGQSTQAVTISSNTPGATFTWTSQANGVTGVAASGTNLIPVQTLINSGNVFDTVIYTAVSDYFNCPGTSATYPVVVNPTPQVILPPAQTVCAGVGSAPVVLSSLVTNTTFTWTASSPGVITGFTPAGTGATIPSQTLANPADTAGTVVFVITPNANTCAGTPANYVITVNPIPDVILPPAQTICSGGSTSVVNLSSDVAGTTYTWTSSASAGITGNTLSGAGNIPVQTLANSGTQLDTVTYVVTPSANTCAGLPVNYFIMVNPVPGVLFVPGPQTLCSGQTSQPVVITSATPGVTITWTAVVPTGITGADTAGLNTIPAQTLFNTLVDTFPRPLPVTYTAQAFTTGTVCPGTPANYTITVEPVPVISFVQNVTNGCSPLSVSFFPNTLNFGIPDTMVFNWGDGSANTVVYPSGVSPQWYPVSHTFNNDSASPQTFVITLTAHGKCVDTSVTRTVTVLPNQISAFFTATPTSGCAPLTVSLHDQSTGPGLLSWCFDFNMQTDSCMGVGEIDSAGSTVNYTFPAGTHTVALYITNGFGCAHDSAFQTIIVSPAPVAAFIFAEDSCSRTPVRFTNQSTLPPNTTVAEYNWQFGNGDSSLLSNPTYTYDTSGVYTACLTVTANTGCADSVCKQIPVFYKPKVSFNNFDTCLNKQPIVFVNTSVGATSYIWNFGDGNTSVLPNPGHGYLTDSTYQVTLIGNNSQCSDTTTQPVVIYPDPVSAFTINPTSVCGAPAIIQMTSHSIDALGFQWSFGNGESSQNVNPSVTYNAVGNYTVCLAVTNSLGCTDTMCHPDTLVVKPLVNFTNFDTCLNTQPIMFTNNSINANEYLWNFGDGNTSVQPNPGHSYGAPGTYNVTLIGILSTCSDTFTFPVVVYPVPVAAFTAPGPYTCGVPANLQMNNTSTGALGYSWNFGNGTTSGDINPVATYTAQGNYTITLAAANLHGCIDSAKGDVQIYAYPSVQSVTVTPSEGCQPVDAQFAVLATNANNYIWNFGDGSSTATTSPVISHVYADTGVYSATVEVYNYGTCGDTILLPDTVTVHIVPQAGFDYSMNETIDSAIGAVQFVNTSLNASSYVWEFGDGDSSSLVNPTHTYPGIDNFDVVLIASTQYGCKDTVAKSIFVIKKSLYVPNAFAPEFNAGNSLVQVWKPAGMGLLDYHAQIFDKWGELLWESTAITNDDMKSPAEGWDGRYQGKVCQQGVYVWKIEATFIDGTLWEGMSYKFQPRKKTIGDVTLIR